MGHKLLDLFCGAGGAAMGYHRAGFDQIVGIDIADQPRYPFDFIKADAVEYLSEQIYLGSLSQVDLIHASPPCQHYTHVNQAAKNRGVQYPDLVGIVRQLLQQAGIPYVIENVMQADMINPIKLCGSMFGLDVRRHRYFECSKFFLTAPCDHKSQQFRFRTIDRKRCGRLARVVGVHGHTNYSGEFDLRCKAMGIDWMINRELVEAIPPAYTEFVGKQFIEKKGEKQCQVTPPKMRSASSIESVNSANHANPG